MAYRCVARVLPGLAALAAASVALPGRVVAGPPQSPAAPQSPPETPAVETLETWTGGQAFGSEWSIWGGAIWAPLGSVRADGVRLRTVLGSGAYQGGSVTFGDLLLGYHKQLGPLTLKVFGGLTMAEHAPVAATSSLGGTALGPKAVVEAWWTLSDTAWLSLDLAFALPYVRGSDRIAAAVESDRIDHTGRLRVGWKLWPGVWPGLSVGLEGGAFGPLAPALHIVPPKSGTAYAGGFLRYAWTGGEVSVSGGLSVDGDEREGDAQAFGTVSLLTRF